MSKKEIKKLSAKKSSKKGIKKSNNNISEKATTRKPFKDINAKALKDNTVKERVFNKHNPIKNINPNDLWFFGKHAVMSALENPKRNLKRLLLTKRTLEQYQDELINIIDRRPSLNPEIVLMDYFDTLLPQNTVHQGIALLTSPLPSIHIKDVCKIKSDQKNLILILDQVTDPHNVGAIIRSAGAFGVKAIITTDRHAPPESGTLAKSASGALEIVPWVRVINLSQTLETLAEMGYWRIGLDGHSNTDINQVDFGDNIALVLGAEGKGLRKGTAAHCDALVKLPIHRSVESLNVSNAAAIALYVFSC
jgi:23S rRNA (guanosine2251-2'-O)-methyltransferase